MNGFEHQTSDPETGRSIHANVTRVGDDIVIVVGGGSRPHVGSVALAQPCGPGRSGVSCSVLTIPPHKEEVVARPIAEAVCLASGHVAVVTAGIHEDRLDSKGIGVY
ncbi:MAG: hypothetical protein ABFS37_16360, partial [Acidobacteriota bacterium]